jgi:hypothetical protein
MLPPVGTDPAPPLDGAPPVPLLLLPLPGTGAPGEAEPVQAPKHANNAPAATTAVNELEEFCIRLGLGRKGPFDE